MTLDPALEHEIATAIENEHVAVGFPPRAVDAVCRQIAAELERPHWAGRPGIVLTSARIRRAFKQLTAARLPRQVVLSHDELARDTHVESLGLVGIEDPTEWSNLFPELSQPLAA
jgi:flagellar biosynthesis component FlhA